MTKTDLSYAYKPAGDLRSAGDPSPAIDDFKNYAVDVCFRFRHNFSKKISPALKNGLERCATRSSTICAKNQALNLKIDEIMTILERRVSRFSTICAKNQALN